MGGGILGDRRIPPEFGHQLIFSLTIMLCSLGCPSGPLARRSYGWADVVAILAGAPRTGLRVLDGRRHGILEGDARWCALGSAWTDRIAVPVQRTSRWLAVARNVGGDRCWSAAGLWRRRWRRLLGGAVAATAALVPTNQ